MLLLNNFFLFIIFFLVSKEFLFFGEERLIVMSYLSLFFLLYLLLNKILKNSLDQKDSLIKEEFTSLYDIILSILTLLKSFIYFFSKLSIFFFYFCSSFNKLFIYNFSSFYKTLNYKYINLNAFSLFKLLILINNYNIITGCFSSFDFTKYIIFKNNLKLVNIKLFKKEKNLLKFSTGVFNKDSVQNLRVNKIFFNQKSPIRFSSSFLNIFYFNSTLFTV